jgi:hypothetical protein
VPVVMIGVRFHSRALTVSRAIYHPRGGLADRDTAICAFPGLPAPAGADLSCTLAKLLEPMSGFEPLACRLQEACSRALGPLPALMPHESAAAAPKTVGFSANSFHDPFHATPLDFILRGNLAVGCYCCHQDRPAPPVNAWLFGQAPSHRPVDSRTGAAALCLGYTLDRSPLPSEVDHPFPPGLTSGVWAANHLRRVMAFPGRSSRL